MNSRVRNGQNPRQRLVDLFLVPTNYTHDCFAEAFGPEIADDVFRCLYRTGKSDRKYRQIVQLKRLKDNFTSKYVFRLYDYHQIETVCIRRKTGTTICLSTQVGCSVKCRFCKSGERGFIRNLSASEIVQQFLFVEENVNRIVFMGIGEPLNNYDDVIKSIRILRDRKGGNFPTDGITVSTVGPVEKLALLREEHLKIQIALSLHATDQQTRDYLVPGMAKYNMGEVLSQVMKYGKRHNRTVTIAYLLLPGINDRNADLERLGRWFSGKNAVINLLKYNGAISNEFRTATREHLMKIKNRLEADNVRVTLRESMGNSIDAACGQLVIK